ncbi:MAG: hypothetical protein BWY79_00585 [Actinobacteria bacterium ADurb.Bin444]|nr:MAG: hypothetical protein BWY79_00585 [Actinobacteria bacterium ADurb.Bin444]
MSSQARGTLAKALTSRRSNVEWAGMLEQLCYMAVELYREGAPTIDLRDVDPYSKPRWLLYPYLETGGPTILFAEGGTGKSVLALWMGLNVALGPKDASGRPGKCAPVLYLDYETSPEIHAERFTALCAGMGIDAAARPPIYYRKMQTSLPQAAAAIRKEIARLGIGLVIVDSLGAAGDGPPEEAATVIPLFTAINRLEVPTLCVHHKRKGSARENQKDRLFGSVYYANAARIVWDCEAVVDPVDDKIAIALTNVKINNGHQLARHGLELQFVNEEEHLKAVKVRRLDKSELAKEPELAKGMSMRDRIMVELSQGAMTVAELAAALDAEESSVRARMTELKKKGAVVNLADHTWGMLSREEAE